MSTMSNKDAPLPISSVSMLWLYGPLVADGVIAIIIILKKKKKEKKIEKNIKLMH